MDVHVKVLGALFVVLGTCGLIAALMLGVLFGGVAGLVGMSGDPDAAIAIPILGLTGIALVGFMVLMSLPGVVIGFGLLRRQSWARIGGIVLSIFQLVWFPLGTIVGAYGLWVLLNPASAPLFPARHTAG